MAVPWVGHFMLEQTLRRQWMNDAKAGDAAAFERIMVLHERMVLRLAIRFLLDPEDAKDAAQEVFFRLHRNLHRFRQDAELLPWLYRMTVNISLDLLRRRKPGMAIGDIIEPADHSLNPEQETFQRQQQRLIAGALCKLTEHERMAIMLRDLEGYPTSCVAEMLGSSEATVRSQISTGRAKMKNFIASRLRKHV